MTIEVSLWRTPWRNEAWKAWMQREVAVSPTSLLTPASEDGRQVAGLPHGPDP